MTNRPDKLYSTVPLTDRDIAEGEAELDHYQNVIRQGNLALAKMIDQIVGEGAL